MLAKRCRLLSWIAVPLALLSAGASEDAFAKPQRIVSMNLCTDQLVMLLADHRRIASVSYLAADPGASALAEQAQSFRLNHGLSEEILPVEPDMVLAGTFTTRPTVFLLRKLGYPVVEVPVASSLDDVRANIRLVAETVGEPERGEAMIADFDRKLPKLEAGDHEAPPLAILYWANGYTSGKGTLANAAVEAAGFRTLAGELGLTGTAQLPLETLLSADADALIMGRKREGAALANEAFRHPALRGAFARHATVTIPDALWVCGTPLVADAVARLAALRDELRSEIGGQASER